MVLARLSNVKIFLLNTRRKVPNLVWVTGIAQRILAMGRPFGRCSPRHKSFSRNPNSQCVPDKSRLALSDNWGHPRRTYLRIYNTYDLLFPRTRYTAFHRFAVTREKTYRTRKKVP